MNIKFCCYCGKKLEHIKKFCTKWGGDLAIRNEDCSDNKNEQKPKISNKNIKRKLLLITFIIIYTSITFGLGIFIGGFIDTATQEEIDDNNLISDEIEIISDKVDQLSDYENSEEIYETKEEIAEEEKIDLKDEVRGTWYIESQFGVYNPGPCVTTLS